MLIIDGSNILSRCRFTAPITDWKMYSFQTVQSILRTIRTFKDRNVVVCWDKGQSIRRKKVAEYYKLREPIDKTTPDGRKTAMELVEYDKARTWLHTTLPKMSIQSLMVEGIEADDCAWCIVEHIVEKPLQESISLVTTDKDWLQIIREGVYWYNIGLRKKNEYGVYADVQDSEKIFTYEDFVATYETREKFVLRKAMLGDTSDTIPKCHLMGETNVGKYVEKLLKNESIADNKAVSKNLQEFIRSGQLSKNIELIDFAFLCKGEEQRIRQAYIESKQKVSQPTFIDWITFGSELDSATMVEFGKYLEWQT